MYITLEERVSSFKVEDMFRFSPPLFSELSLMTRPSSTRLSSIAMLPSSVSMDLSCAKSTGLSVCEMPGWAMCRTAFIDGSELEATVSSAVRTASPSFLETWNSTASEFIRISLTQGVCAFPQSTENTVSAAEQRSGAE